MSQAIRDFEKSEITAADLSADEFLIVKADTGNSGQIALATAATDPIVGVLQNKPKAGATGLYRMSGTTKVKAGGTVTVGDRVTTNGSGQAITTTTAGNSLLGIALESAVSGDVFEVQLTIGAFYHA